MAHHRLFAGCYTEPAPHAPDAEGRGISAYDFDADTGTLHPLGLAAPISNPSFLAAHPSGRALYAVSEVAAGRLSAFEVSPQPAVLRPLGTYPTEGAAPAHLGLDPHGRCVYAVNYAGGAAVVAFLTRPDGSLGPRAAAEHAGGGPNPARQAGPHPHGVQVSPDGRHVYVCDLGTDEVVTYAPPEGKPALRRLNGLRLPPGGGPRHLAFEPSGHFAYAALELSAQVAALGRDPQDGALTLLQTVSVRPEPYAGESWPAEVLVSADGAFVYVTNRGPDSVAIFQVRPETGELTRLGDVPTLGKTPRGAAFSPGETHLLVANQDSSTVAVFRRDARTGGLSGGATFACPTPTDLCFVP